MTIVAWWSTRTREVCLSLDPVTARQLAAHLDQVEVLGGFMPSAMWQFLAGLKDALAQVPPEAR